MEYGSIGAIAKAGMTLERNRLELASVRLSQANIAFSSAQEALNSANDIRDRFLQLSNANGIDQAEMSTSIKTVHDPSHPKADANGNVFMMDVNPTTEMAVLVSAVRAYEANVRAFNTNGEMNQAARSIGKN